MNHLGPGRGVHLRRGPRHLRVYHEDDVRILHVGVGVALNLRPEDYITYQHRSRSMLVPKGVDLGHFYAECMFKQDGQSRGKAGESQFRDLEHGVVCSSLLLGNSIAFGVGVALGNQYKGNNSVTIALFGDGASQSGYFHPSMNLASLWKLPVVFVCLFNSWAQFVPARLTESVENISVRAAGYNMPGLTVDGSDVLAVYEAAGEFIARAREGKGPSFLECKVPRWRGHFYGDVQRYRDPKDSEAAQKIDCLAKYQEKLLKDGVLTGQVIEETEQRIKAKIDKALEFALASPPVVEEELLKDVYVKYP